MRYLLMIYTDEKQEAQQTPEEQEANMGEYFSYTEEIRQAGVMLGGNALQPTSTATTVRVQGGQAISTDGPFAETKEQLGGYYLLDCENLDEAIKWAAKIPGARHGCIEIRPLWEFDE